MKILDVALSFYMQFTKHIQNNLQIF